MNTFKFFHKNNVPLLNRSLLPHEQFISYQHDDGGYSGRVIAWTLNKPGVDWIVVKYTGSICTFFNNRLFIPQIKSIFINGINYDSEMLNEIDIIRGATVLITYFEQIN